jgi:hypothetical protein
MTQQIEIKPGTSVRWKKLPEITGTVLYEKSGYYVILLDDTSHSWLMSGCPLFVEDTVAAKCLGLKFDETTSRVGWGVAPSDIEPIPKPKQKEPMNPACDTKQGTRLRRIGTNEEYILVGVNMRDAECIIASTDRKRSNFTPYSVSDFRMDKNIALTTKYAGADGIDAKMFGSYPHSVFEIIAESIDVMNATHEVNAQTKMDTPVLLNGKPATFIAASPSNNEKCVVWQDKPVIVDYTELRLRRVANESTPSGTRVLWRGKSATFICSNYDNGTECIIRFDDTDTGTGTGCLSMPKHREAAFKLGFSSHDQQYYSTTYASTYVLSDISSNQNVAAIDGIESKPGVVVDESTPSGTRVIYKGKLATLICPDVMDSKSRIIRFDDADFGGRVGIPEHSKAAFKLGFNPHDKRYASTNYNLLTIANDQKTPQKQEETPPSKITAETLPGTILLFEGQPYVFICHNHSGSHEAIVHPALSSQRANNELRFYSNPRNIEDIQKFGLAYNDNGNAISCQARSIPYQLLTAVPAPSVALNIILAEIRRQALHNTPGSRRQWNGQNVAFIGDSLEEPGYCWIRIDNIAGAAWDPGAITEPEVVEQAKLSGYNPESPAYLNVETSELSDAKKPSSHIKPGDIITIEENGIREEAIVICDHAYMDRYVVRLKSDTKFVATSGSTRAVHRMAQPRIIHATHKAEAMKIGFNPDDERYASIVSDVIIAHHPIGSSMKVGDKYGQYVAPSLGVMEDALIIHRNHNEPYGWNLTSDHPFAIEKAKALGFEPTANEFAAVSLGKFSWDDPNDLSTSNKYLELEKGDIVKLKLDGLKEECEAIVITDASTHDSVVVLIKEPSEEFIDRYGEENTGSFSSDFSDEIKIAKDMGLTLNNDNLWICSRYDTEVVENIGKHKTNDVLSPALMLLGALGGAALTGLMSGMKPQTSVRVDTSTTEDMVETAVEEVANIAS